MRLKKYPTRIIPTVQIAIKMQSSLGFIAFFSIIIDGSESVITPIKKAITTPRFAPFATSASAMGIQPNISAYIGIPHIAAMITPKGFPVPRTFTIHSSGIQLWMIAPIPTPAIIYGRTFFAVSATFSQAYFILSRFVSSFCGVSMLLPFRMNSST